MYRPADVDNIRDFGQYYRSSYIGYYDKDCPGLVTPLWISRNAGEDPKTVVVHKLVKATGGHGTPGGYISVQYTLLFPDLLKNCQFGMPQFGSVIHGQTAVYNYRDSPREGFRGFRYERLQSHRFGLWYYQNNEVFENDSDKQDSVWYTFNPYYYSPEQAFQMVDSGERLACPVSRYFTVHADNNVVTPALSYKTEMIGAFAPEGDTVVLSKEYADYLAMVREITKMRVQVE